jgi:hypothetical protein
VPFKDWPSVKGLIHIEKYIKKKTYRVYVHTHTLYVQDALSIVYKCFLFPPGKHLFSLSLCILKGRILIMLLALSLVFSRLALGAVSGPTSSAHTATVTATPLPIVELPYVSQYEQRRAVSCTNLG